MTWQVNAVGDRGPHSTNYDKGTERTNKESDELKIKRLQKEISKEELDEVVDETKKTIDLFNKKLDFKVHEETDRIVVKVVDKDTGKIIKEIPPEEILELAARIERFLGVFIDEKV